jgi:hypothetical protein
MVLAQWVPQGDGVLREVICLPWHEGRGACLRETARREPPTDMRIGIKGAIGSADRRENGAIVRRNVVMP